MLFKGVILGFFVSFAAGNEWSYDDPSKWKNDYPKCGGDKQSPVNILRSNLTCDESLVDSLTFGNYGTAAKDNFTIKNNGHTCTVDTSAAKASVSLKSVKYNLAQFHFHWGSADNKGSEHQVDSVKYPAELHFVHYNSKYSSLSVAVNKSDGLAVLAVFIKVGEVNAAFNHFLDLNVSTDGSSVHFEAFAVKDVLPDDTSFFYRYSGSLTTPTCDQTVTWTVFSNTIEMSQAQLEKFRALKTDHGKPLVDNFRAVQPLNGRMVSASFSDGDLGCNSAGYFKPSIVMVLFFAFFRFGF